MKEPKKPSPVYLSEHGMESSPTVGFSDEACPCCGNKKNQCKKLFPVFDTASFSSADHSISAVHSALCPPLARSGSSFPPGPPVQSISGPQNKIPTVHSAPFGTLSSLLTPPRHSSPRILLIRALRSWGLLPSAGSDPTNVASSSPSFAQSEEVKLPQVKAVISTPAEDKLV